MKDIFDVNESEANISSTNYTLYLTKKEIEELERIRQRNEYVFEKQKNARSSIIKKIVENTYLYLNNNERFFMNDLEKIINKDYYNNIDMDFLRRIATVDNKKIKKIKTDTKEYDLILELVRNQLLRIISSKYIDDELEKVQLRLAKNDEKMLRIIAGNKSLSLNDFLSGYIRYFLSLPNVTQNYILAYQTFLKLDRAIKEGKMITINDMKYKPIKVIKPSYLDMFYKLICFDGACDSFNVLLLSKKIPHGMILKDISFTEEDFVINSYENAVLDLYNNLNEVEISFVLVNDSSDFINKLIDVNNNAFFKFEKILDLKNENNKYILKIKYDDRIIKNLIKENNKSIKYLCFSDNYNDFIKLTEPKMKEYNKYLINLRNLEGM